MALLSRAGPLTGYWNRAVVAAECLRHHIGSGKGSFTMLRAERMVCNPAQELVDCGR
jgi:hypothetical protein